MRRPLSIMLATLAGLLIGFPVMLTLQPVVGLPLMVLFGAVGARIGYMKGESAAFFYFVLVCDLILISLMGRGQG